MADKEIQALLDSKITPGSFYHVGDGSIIMGDKDGKPIFVTRTWATHQFWRTKDVPQP